MSPAARSRTAASNAFAKSRSLLAGNTWRLIPSVRAAACIHAELGLVVWVGRVDEQCEVGGSMNQFVHQLQSLRCDLVGECGYAREVAAWSVQACYEAERNRIGPGEKNYRWNWWPPLRLRSQECH